MGMVGLTRTCIQYLFYARLLLYIVENGRLILLNNNG